MTAQLLDPTPIIAVFAIFGIVSLIAYEVGFRIGRWWQDRTPGETEGLTNMLVGSLLALMAFLLAVTMGMASDRFDTRRGLVLQEANAIGTAFLRAGYLPDPADDQVRELLRGYAQLRTMATDRERLAIAMADSERMHGELWTIAENVARTTDQGDLTALFLDSLNEVIDLHETRVAAGVYARVPETVLLLLIFGSALSIGMVGFNAGLTKRRSLLSAFVLIIALGAVITLVIDLDRPRDGFIQVSQQPLFDLQRQIGPPGQ